MRDRSSAIRFASQLALVFGLTSLSFSQTPFWQQTNGPYGGTIYAVSGDSTEQLFAGSEGGGVFRSTDLGTTWSMSNSGLSNPLIYALTSNSRGDLFAGTGGSGVFRSTDRGRTWANSNEGIADNSILSLTLDTRHAHYTPTPRHNTYT